MGAADTVPGVSGGTIAFITGIYEELVSSLRAIGPEALGHLLGRRFKAFWRHINGNFLSVLFLGILSSVIVLSRLILFLLTDYPVLIWAFFFGLIVASALVVTRKISAWNFKVVADLVELRNIATVADLIIQCAMHRKESRGLHYTIEYPEKDDRRWLKDTVLRRPFVG